MSVRKRLLKRIGIGLAALVVLGFLGLALWYQNALQPMPKGPQIMVRFSKSTPAADALSYLARKGVVRDTLAMRVYLFLNRGPNTIHSGTFQFQPGDPAELIVKQLETPLVQFVRLPETNWARRDANLLQSHHVAAAHDYLSLVHDPSEFRTTVDFPLPPDSLEGYLYPDTYDLPPLLGARAVVVRRLKNFEQKVWSKIGPIADLPRVITIASLVQLEAGADEDRPMIAGVIENRLKKGMPLQIDAGIMYALGKWRRLYFKDYKNVKSPYNLYLHKGLPPTPICSPSIKSIEAALHPADHDYLYYVALPNGHSLFAKTPAQHEHNIRVRLAAIKAAALAKRRRAMLDMMVPASLPTGTSKQ